MTIAASSSPVCNIAARGKSLRYRVSFLLLLCTLALIFGFHQYYPTASFLLRLLILVPATVATLTTGFQSRAETCVVNAVFGVTEDEQGMMRRIKEFERDFQLKVKAIGVVGAGTFLGVVLGGLAAVAPFLRMAKPSVGLGVYVEI